MVRTAERETRISIRKLADMFQCGKIQISTIFKDKDRIIELYEKNASEQMCHTRKRVRESKFSDVNEALYQWYLLAVSKNIYPDGSHLMEKAKEITDKLGVSDSFNGWLDRWKKRNNVKRMTVSGIWGRKWLGCSVLERENSKYC